ncbi:serine/threonine-protein kinase [Actinomycetospora aeridis]|uniref:serine/threonine-protein kinase n=1 Tax=Actinomycetospora aeridis TaxID=3129231 RepID=UPI00359FDE98
MSPAPTDAAGPRRIVGRYRLEHELGRGAMGTVWSAYDEVLHRSVAVKEVRLSSVPVNERAIVRERTLREARATAMLSHPNVVTLYDVVEVASEPYVVMELLPSRSLASYIGERGRLTQPEAAEIGSAVASALTTAHRAGITHRDVKPGNVLIGENGQIKLTDFGIARNAAEQSMTQTGTVLGSPPYIAPEVAMGRAVGPAADLWGLGATLFACLEGRPPYDAGDPVGTVTEVVHGEVPVPAGRGPVVDVIRGLMVKDPALRMPLAAVRRRLRPLLSDPEGPVLATSSAPRTAAFRVPRPGPASDAAGLIPASSSSSSRGPTGTLADGTPATPATPATPEQPPAPRPRPSPGPRTGPETPAQSPGKEPAAEVEAPAAEKPAAPEAGDDAPSGEVAAGAAVAAAAVVGAAAAKDEPEKAEPGKDAPGKAEEDDSADPDGETRDGGEPEAAEAAESPESAAPSAGEQPAAVEAAEDADAEPEAEGGAAPDTASDEDGTDEPAVASEVAGTPAEDAAPAPETGESDVAAAPGKPDAEQPEQLAGEEVADEEPAEEADPAVEEPGTDEAGTDEAGGGESVADAVDGPEPAGGTSDTPDTPDTGDEDAAAESDAPGADERDTDEPASGKGAQDKPAKDKPAKGKPAPENAASDTPDTGGSGSAANGTGNGRTAIGSSSPSTTPPSTTPPPREPPPSDAETTMVGPRVSASEDVTRTVRRPPPPPRTGPPTGARWTPPGGAPAPGWRPAPPRPGAPGPGTTGGPGQPLAPDPGPLPFAPTPRPPAPKRSPWVVAAVVALLVLMAAIGAVGAYALTRSLAGQGATTTTLTPSGPEVAGTVLIAHADSDERYSGTGLGFSALVPAGWQQFRLEQAGGDITVRFVSPDATRELRVDRVADFYPSQTAADYVALLGRAANLGVDGSSVGPVETVGAAAPGAEAPQQTVYRTTSGPDDRTTWARLVPSGNDLWVVRLTAPSADPVGAPDQFRAVADSFAVPPPEAAPR